MNAEFLCSKKFHPSPKSVMTSFACVIGLMWLSPTGTLAQAPPITSSGLNTQVSAPMDQGGGVTQYNITGGTRPGNGGNLFHSFGIFDVPANNIANFLNDSGLNTANILARVTGNSASDIFGTIETTGFGNANLFLMNPAGIVFGPDAVLNVGGDVGGNAYFTTANYIRLTDNVQFTALPSAQDAVLSTADVAAFGFLDANPASIMVDGSALSVQPGKTLALVGGDITVGSSLTAPGGKVILASTASAGEFLNPSFEDAANINGAVFGEKGTIILNPGTTLDVSDDAAGTVIIRGGEFMLTDATIMADTVDTPAEPVGIDISVTGGVSLSTSADPALAARTNGDGNAGEVYVKSNSLEAQSTVDDFAVAIIDTSTFGTGNGGKVHIMTGDLTVDGGPFGATFIESGTGGDGNGGEVTIHAAHANFINAPFITTGDTNLGGVGSGGNFSLHADSITTNGLGIATDSNNARGGDLVFNAHDITFVDSSIGVLSLLGESVITIDAHHFVMNSSNLLNQTAFGPGGGTTVTSNIVELNNSQIASQTFADADAGPISVTATDRFTISDDPSNPGNPGGLFTNSFAAAGTNGRPGAINVTTQVFTVNGGARLNSTTETSGPGSDVIINAQIVSISGERNFEVPSEIFGLGSTRASGIYTRTVGTDDPAGPTCTGPCGSAGNVFVNTAHFHLDNGAVVDSGTTTSGPGGNVTVQSSGDVWISGTRADGTPGGIFSRSTGTDPAAGSGGDVSLTAGQMFRLDNGATVAANATGTADSGSVTIAAGGNIVTDNATVATSAAQGVGGGITMTSGNDINLRNNTTVSSESFGAGDAGDITIGNANTQSILVENSTIRTNAANADGGNIKLDANFMIQVVNSTISSSVAGGAGAGGNINFDPQFILIQNSQILANAFGGPGGNITLTASAGIFSDTLSIIDASSQFGTSGNVNISAPIQNLNGVISQLPEDALRVAALYAERCAAQKGGQFSSFAQGGPEGLPPVPGGFITSPLSLQGLQSPLPAQGFSPTTNALAARLGFAQAANLAALGHSGSWRLGSSPAGCAA